MTYNTHLKAFTLVEIMVSMTILSLIMVSVVTLFLFSSQMSQNVEMNRTMQENIKNVVEDITEGVRKNGELGSLDTDGTSCSTSVLSNEGLCVGDRIYVLGNKDISGDWVRVSEAECSSNIESNCRILTKKIGESYYPLTNGFVAFKKVRFIITNTDIPKLTIQLTVQPASKKGTLSSMLESNSIVIQTTVSHRLINTK